MKRFWKKTEVRDGAILLDGRGVRTPSRNILAVPSVTLADAIAAEWDAQGETVDPRSMPLTGLANAAIDRVAPDPIAFGVDLARYGESDLLCYRADDPPELVARQAEQWDPLLDWARGRYDIHFDLASGVIHRPQPEATVERLRHAVEALDPFLLASLSPLVTIGGSLVIGLALIEEAVAPEEAFDAAHLDERWQAEQWGEDQLALDARLRRRADFLAAARFVELSR